MFFFEKKNQKTFILLGGTPHLTSMLQTLPPRPPIPQRQRSQAEAFLVLRRNMLEMWGEPAYEKDFLTGSFLGRPQIMLNAPEGIRHVLVNNHENYRRNPATRRIVGPIFGSGLFLAEGEPWRHQRRTIAPALAPRTLPILARHVAAASAAATEKLAKLVYRPIELLPHLQHLALEIAGRSMFSLEMSGFGTELREKLMRYGLRYAQPRILDLLLPENIPSPADRGRAAFRVEWLEFLDRLIALRKTLAVPDDHPRDLFDLLSLARDPESGAGFDHAQLRDEVSTMILAGHETTGVTLFWACYLAALYPDHQENLAREADQADLSPDFAASALPALPQMRAHIDEAMRLYPPAFMIIRQAQQADTVLGHEVAPGTVITIAPWVLHRHRARWKEPDAFDHTRFLPGAPPPDRYAYMPFGAGPRICVGAQFALTEAVLVLAGILKKFRIELCGSGAVMPRAIVTTQPDRAVRFVLSPR
jgi:unspecific monooxygenase